MSAPWRWMDAAERAAYEKAHGCAPPGYRATGAVDWFSRRHEDRGPCHRCGVMTDRWYVVNLRGGMTAGTPGPDQKSGATQKRGLLADYLAECSGCTDAESIRVYEVRQGNPALSEKVKRAEAELLKALQAQRAAA